MSDREALSDKIALYATVVTCILLETVSEMLARRFVEYADQDSSTLVNICIADDKSF